MIPAMANALSGLNAAERRLAVSANNTANLTTTGRVENGAVASEPYQPQRVSQVSQEKGGVRADVAKQEPSTYPVYNPNDPGADKNGIAQMPNVSLEGEVMQQQLATYDFKANLMVVKAADGMMKNLLNIVA